MLFAAEFAIGFDLFQTLFFLLSSLNSVTACSLGGLTLSVPLCQTDVRWQGAVTAASWGRYSWAETFPGTAGSAPAPLGTGQGRAMAGNFCSVSLSSRTRGQDQKPRSDSEKSSWVQVMRHAHRGFYLKK